MAVAAVVVVSAARTPIGRYGGAFRNVHPAELGAVATVAALARAHVEPSSVDEILMGHGRQAGSGPNPARQVGRRAGLPDSVHAQTINKACASGMQAIASAAQSILLGENDVVIAGGIESMSRMPYLIDSEDARWGHKMGNFTLIDAKGRAVIVEADEHPRPDTTVESLRKLPPVFGAVEGHPGIITAGTSSGITDGGAAVVLMSAARAKSLQLTPLARIVGWASAGVDPRIMGIGPVPAMRKLFARTGLTIADFDLFELNEAFAPQVLAVLADEPMPRDRLNVNGGAIALGHPIGCTGTRIAVTLLHEMARRDSKRGLATLCVSGGMGMAMAFER